MIAKPLSVSGGFARSDKSFIFNVLCRSDLLDGCSRRRPDALAKGTVQTTTDTSEKGLETLVTLHMTGEDGLPASADVARERPAPYGGTGYVAGVAREFDRAHALDEADPQWERDEQSDGADV